MKTDRPAEESNAADIRPGTDRLPLLYQGFLIAVVRVQSNREKILDAVNFRKRMKAALQDVERAAAALNYDYQDIQDAHLAVVAFLDEVILTSEDSSRIEWMNFPLALDLLNESAAGEKFFEKLEEMLRTSKDTARLSDILEVYLLCMTLGFEGKFSSENSAGLRSWMEKSRSRIELIRQQRGSPLSPDGVLPDDFSQLQLAGTENRNLLFAAIGAAVGAIVLFIAANIHLASGVRQILESLK